MRIHIDLLTDNGLRIGTSASIDLSQAESKALAQYTAQHGHTAEWAKAAIQIALEACGALDGIPQTPDFLIKDEGEFALVYPNNEKAMAFAKTLKTATWYSEKSIAIDIRSRRAVESLLVNHGFTVEHG